MFCNVSKPKRLDFLRSLKNHDSHCFCNYKRQIFRRKLLNFSISWISFICIAKMYTNCQWNPAGCQERHFISLQSPNLPYSYKIIYRTARFKWTDIWRKISIFRTRDTCNQVSCINKVLQSISIAHIAMYTKNYKLLGKIIIRYLSSCKF